jgi:hypothetical protein
VGHTTRVAPRLIISLGTVALAALLGPPPLFAQAASGISLVPTDPRRWDVSGDVGWLSSNKSGIAAPWNDWYDVAAGGGSAGFYVTPHVKAELRLAFSAEGRVDEEERLDVPGQTFPAFRLREHHFRTSTLGAAIAYQLFDNQWFHPHLGVGFEIVRERERVFAPEWRMPPRGIGPPVVIPGSNARTGVAWAVRPLLSTGFKWYVNERGFVRTDVRVAIGNRRAAHVGWTAGIGVDL